MACLCLDQPPQSGPGIMLVHQRSDPAPNAGPLSAVIFGEGSGLCSSDMTASDQQTDFGSKALMRSAPWVPV